MDFVGDPLAFGNNAGSPFGCRQLGSGFDQLINKFFPLPGPFPQGLECQVNTNDYQGRCGRPHHRPIGEVGSKVEDCHAGCPDDGDHAPIVREDPQVKEEERENAVHADGNDGQHNHPDGGQPGQPHDFQHEPVPDAGHRHGVEEGEENTEDDRHNGGLHILGAHRRPQRPNEKRHG